MWLKVGSVVRRSREITACGGGGGSVRGSGGYMGVKRGQKQGLTGKESAQGKKTSEKNGLGEKRGKGGGEKRFRAL